MANHDENALVTGHRTIDGYIELSQYRPGSYNQRGPHRSSTQTILRVRSVADKRTDHLVQLDVSIHVHHRQANRVVTSGGGMTLTREAAEALRNELNLALEGK